MIEITFDSTFYLLMTIHCLIGSAAAMVAVSKGYDLVRWLGIGLIGGTIALVFTLYMPKKSQD